MLFKLVSFFVQQWWFPVAAPEYASSCDKDFESYVGRDSIQWNIVRYYPIKW